jgi:hypothetical protein
VSWQHSTEIRPIRSWPRLANTVNSECRTLMLRRRVL